MIKAVIVLNQKGKVRLQRFYEEEAFQSLGFSKEQIFDEIYQSISAKSHQAQHQQQSQTSIFKDESVSLSYANFISDCETLPSDCKLVFRTYASLTIVFVIDQEESELAILDLIQVFVEILDSQFSNVCEVDLVFNPHKLGYVLDELIVDGMVCETDIR